VARGKNKEQINKEQTLLCVPRLHPSLRDGRGEEENRPSLYVARGKKKNIQNTFCFALQIKKQFPGILLRKTPAQRLFLSDFSDCVFILLSYCFTVIYNVFSDLFRPIPMSEFFLIR
jgi:hypothetical protein